MRKRTSTPQPRSQAAALSMYKKAVFKKPALGYAKEGHMLRAKCKRFAGRTIVVGKTAFSFDTDGVTSVVDQGNVRDDYNQLIQMNQVVALPEGDENPPMYPAQDSTITSVVEPVVTTSSAPEVAVVPEPLPEPEPVVEEESEADESEPKKTSSKKAAAKKTTKSKDKE